MPVIFFFYPLWSASSALAAGSASLLYVYTFSRSDLTITRLIQRMHTSQPAGTKGSPALRRTLRL